MFHTKKIQMDKALKLMNVGWWPDIDKRDLSMWIGNFGNNMQASEALLDSVVFYTRDQIEAIIQDLEGLLEKMLYVEYIKHQGAQYENDAVIKQEYRRNRKNMRILPAALASDPASSAMLSVRDWRDFLVNKIEISNIEKIHEDLENQVNRFIFVNDFVGTGNEINEFFEEQIVIKDENIRICDIPIKYQVEFILCLYMIHEEGEKLLATKYPHIKVLTAEKLTQIHNLTNTDCCFLNCFSKDEKENIVNFLTESMHQFTLDKFNLGIPIIYYYGCPNNTLPLFWENEGNWVPLYRQGGGRQ